mmetsp:Transcript_3909/g.11694  ORF Transcript_3909/g.11694 Transcript_3909/m.11694 type:complete len:440 (+) Transcript_3909:278-1597(+)
MGVWVWICWLVAGLVTLAASESDIVDFRAAQSNPRLAPRQMHADVQNETAYIYMGAALDVEKAAGKYDITADEKLMFSFGLYERKHAIPFQPVRAGGRPFVTLRILNPDIFEEPEQKKKKKKKKAKTRAIFDFSFVVNSIVFQSSDGEMEMALRDMDWQPLVHNRGSQRVENGLSVNTSLSVLTSKDEKIKIIVGAAGSTMKFPHGVVTPQSVSVAVATVTDPDVPFNEVKLSTLVCSPGKRTLSSSDVFGHDPFLGIKSKYKYGLKHLKYRGYLAWSPWIRRNGFNTFDTLEADHKAVLDEEDGFDVDGLSQPCTCAMVNISSSSNNVKFVSTRLEWELRLGFGATPPLFDRHDLWLPIAVVACSVVIIAIATIGYAKNLRALANKTDTENVKKRLLSRQALADEVQPSYNSLEILGAYDGQPSLLRSCSDSLVRRKS